MDIKDLNDYYFPTYDIQFLRNKYFNNIIDYIGEKEFTVDVNYSSDERVINQTKIENKIIKYFELNKEIKNEFIKVYRLASLPFLSELILQSLSVYLHLKHKDSNDVFLSPTSILYFENQFPVNILAWQKNKNLNILDECRFYSKIQNII